MTFKIGKHDFYWFVLLFLFVALPIGVMIGLIIYYNDWYTILKWSVGLLIFIPVCILSFKYIPFVKTKKRNIVDILQNSFLMILTIIIIGVPVILYVFTISYFENFELKKYGKETVGFIYDYGSTKTSRYHKVYFINTENKKYKSEINGNYSLYNLGDTVRVIYSERIPEINRAD